MGCLSQWTEVFDQVKDDLQEPVVGQKDALESPVQETSRLSFWWQRLNVIIIIGSVPTERKLKIGVFLKAWLISILYLLQIWSSLVLTLLHIFTCWLEAFEQIDYFCLCISDCFNNWFFVSVCWGRMSLNVGSGSENICGWDGAAWQQCFCELYDRLNSNGHFYQKDHFSQRD